MIKRNLIIYFLLFLIYTNLTTSCESHDPSKNTHQDSILIIGDPSNVNIQRIDDTIITKRPYDEQIRSLDIDNNGIPDFQLTVVIDGSNGLGYATNHFLECLHDRAFFSGSIVTDTLYYTERFFIDDKETYVWFQTIQTTDCYPSDSIVSTNDYIHLQAYQKGDLIKMASEWHSGEYLFKTRTYSGGYKDYQTADTTFYISYNRWYRCLNHPLDIDFFVAIKLVNGDGHEQPGWIKMRLSGFDIKLYETAIRS